MKTLQCPYCDREYGDKTIDYWLLERIGACVDDKEIAMKKKREQEREALKEQRRMERKGL